VCCPVGRIRAAATNTPRRILHAMPLPKKERKKLAKYFEADG
jgi:hypothetical protein